ncbi:MAG TPA: globin [Gammaproteobacteria bacterium]
MHEEEIQRFNDSLERCSANGEFLERFYALFLASSGEVAAKFAHTDFRRQARMLRTSLYIMMLSSDDDELGTHLEHLAQRHSSRDLDIRPELYDLWLDCLLQAVAEFDPRFDAAAAAAWRRVLQPGIEYMKSRY